MHTWNAQTRWNLCVKPDAIVRQHASLANPIAEERNGRKGMAVRKHSANPEERKSEKDQAVAMTRTLRTLPFSLACLTSLLKEMGINQSNRNGEGGERGSGMRKSKRERERGRWLMEGLEPD